MSYFILLLFSLFTQFQTILSTDPFASFETNNHGIYSSSGPLLELYHNTTNLFIKTSGTPDQLIKLQPDGTQTASTFTLPNFTFTSDLNNSQVYWQQYKFTVAGKNGSDAVLQQYDYNFNPVTGFGTNGIATLSGATIGGGGVSFTAVTLDTDNTYYAAGTTTTNNYIVVANFDKTGSLATNFGQTQTSNSGKIGYYILNSTGTPRQMFVLKYAIIILTDSGQLITISKSDGTTSVLRSSFPTTYTIALDSTNTYIYTSELSSGHPVINRYVDPTLTTPDSNFATAGTLTPNFTSFPNGVTVSSIDAISNKLFISGSYITTNGGSTYAPFIQCYDITDAITPILDTTFAGTSSAATTFASGQFIGDPSIYSNPTGNDFKMSLVQGDGHPSLFFTFDKYLTHIQLDGSFVIGVDLFKTFAQNNTTAGVYSSTNPLTDVHVITGNVFLVSDTNNELITLQPDGTSTTALTNPFTPSNFNFSGDVNNFQASWNTSSFIIGGKNGNDAVLQQYDYNFNPVTRFGTNGIATLPSATIGDNGGSFTAVTTAFDASSFYATGITNTNNYIIIANFDATGNLLNANFQDNTGKAVSSYILNGTSDPKGTPRQILTLSSTAVLILTDRNQLISVSTADGTATVVKDSVYGAISAGDNTIYTCEFNSNYNTFFIYKYAYDTSTVDQTFACVGTFEPNFTSFPYGVNIWSLNLIGTKLFISGGYITTSGGSTYAPFIQCYDITNSDNPILDTTFQGTSSAATTFTNGQFIGNPTVYASPTHNNLKMSAYWFPQNTSALFFTFDRYLTRLSLDSNFTMPTEKKNSYNPIDNTVSNIFNVNTTTTQTLIDQTNNAAASAAALAIQELNSALQQTQQALLILGQQGAIESTGVITIQPLTMSTNALQAAQTALKSMTTTTSILQAMLQQLLTVVSSTTGTLTPILNSIKQSFNTSFNTSLQNILQNNINLSLNDALQLLLEQTVIPLSNSLVTLKSSALGSYSGLTSNTLSILNSALSTLSLAFQVSIIAALQAGQIAQTNPTPQIKQNAQDAQTAANNVTQEVINLVIQVIQIVQSLNPSANKVITTSKRKIISSLTQFLQDELNANKIPFLS